MKKAKMKVKRLAFVLLSIATMISCNNDPIIPDDTGDSGSSSGGNDSGGTKTGTGKSIALKVYVPKNSIKTYASEDATTLENHIDTIFVDLFQAPNTTIPVESHKFFGTYLQDAVVSGTKDSVLMIAYEVENLVAGTVTAKVYANRKTVIPITGEIQMPVPNSTPTTSFLMTDSTNLTYNSTAYSGTVHIVRDVAKLRINVSKDAICLPSDLIIDYPNIKIEVQNVAKQTSLFGQSREEAYNQSPTNFYINYAERTGASLRPFNNSINAFTGGQIDSLYLNENLRTTYSAGTNTTQVRVTIPTKSATEGNKTDSYTYTININGNYDIVRNTIYTLDIKVRGQSLEPLITLSLKPWDDVNVEGTIRGTYLTMQTSEVEFDASGYAEIAFCTDAQAVYIDYSDFNLNNTEQIGREIQTVGIQPADPNLTPNYQGQVLMDKKVCTSFGFQINSANIKPDAYNFSGRVCIKAGNIRKCIAFVGQRIYDAHFIVGENLLGSGDTFTSADVTTESAVNDWLEVSPNRLYTNNATTNYSGSAVPLYLHLNENLSGQIRKGSITVFLANGAEKKIYIQQLPALPIGQFGYDGTNDGDDAGILFRNPLYTEQLYEYSTMPRYSNPSNTSVSLNNNNIYNGLGTTRANFDATNYGGATPFNWHATYFEAINYCAYKNRDENKNGTIDPNERKWYLPSQAQLMAMWVSYESYKGVSFSNFKTDSYWSATNNILYPGESQYLNFKYGNVGHYNRSTQYWTRCVRNGTVTPNSMLVSQASDTDIRFDFTSLPAGARSTAGGYGQDNTAANATVPDKLQLGEYSNTTKYTWDDAKTFCTNNGGGRLPTQRELQLIWILKSEITRPNIFIDDYYWTATESSAYPNNAYMIYMGSGSAGDAGNTPHIVKTHTALVRCVYPTY